MPRIYYVFRNNNNNNKINIIPCLLYSMKCTNPDCGYEWEFKAIKRKNPLDTACPSCKTMIRLRERTLK